MMDYKKLDWNEIWMEQQKRNMATVQHGGCWQSWQEKTAAQTYLERSKNRVDIQYRLQDLLGLVEPDWHVLDIGSGPGILSIPLALSVSHVTAVEPADGMVAVFQDELIAQQIRNMTIIHKKWDDVDINVDLCAPYHLTICSFSLGMLDLKASIQKMIAVTSKQIVIYWHANHQTWDEEALHLWPLLYDKEYCPIPKCDVLLNLLHSMKIYPDVQVLPRTTRYTFASFEEAVTEYTRRFEVHTESQINVLRKYLEVKLTQEKGLFILKHDDIAMRVAWKADVKDGYGLIT